MAMKMKVELPPDPHPRQAHMEEAAWIRVVTLLIPCGFALFCGLLLLPRGYASYYVPLIVGFWAVYVAYTIGRLRSYRSVRSAWRCNVRQLLDQAERELAQETLTLVNATFAPLSIDGRPPTEYWIAFLEDSEGPKFVYALSAETTREFSLDRWQGSNKAAQFPAAHYDESGNLCLGTRIAIWDDQPMAPV